MEHSRYHLVFESFKPDANKTAVSYTLKDQLTLTDAQLADMMAGRRTVLKQNMPKEAALTLGKELTKAGLVVKAQALAPNQKNSPGDVRNHLLQGGLDQYFASKYRHPDEELDTRMSLLVLSILPVTTYLLLPVIGLLLLMPLLSISTWGDQFFAAAIQLLIALMLFVPAAVLRPKSYQPEGLALEKDTEELLWQLSEKLADHLSAPQIIDIILVESPVLAIHQTPLQWVKNSASLEVGLPVLEALNLQQFVGLLAMRMTPMATRFYARTWGLFTQWHGSLRSRHKPLAMKLNNWVLPIHEHQKVRSTNAARELVGFQESLRLQRIEDRFGQLSVDWPEFMSFCQKLRIRGHHWEALLSKELNSEKKTDEILASFRIEAPALWVLSTLNGYQRVFSRKANGPLFEMQGARLWQQFQRYNQFQDRFAQQMIRPAALIPPLKSNAKKHNLNALLLNKQASDVLALQRQMIEQALGMHKKPKKLKDISKLTEKWRATSATFWPEGFAQHKLFPLAKSAYLSLQTLQQIDLWAFDDDKLPENKHRVRDKQVATLFDKWLTQISKLPALPLISENSGKLLDQIKASTRNSNDGPLSAKEILEKHHYWQEIMTVYWTFIAGQILKPKTFADEMAEQA